MVKINDVPEIREAESFPKELESRSGYGCGPAKAKFAAERSCRLLVKSSYCAAWQI